MLTQIALATTLNLKKMSKLCSLKRSIHVYHSNEHSMASASQSSLSSILITLQTANKGLSELCPSFKLSCLL